MGIRNKVLVNIVLPSGNRQEDGEVETNWTPVNFAIYSDLFPGLINEAIEQWLSERHLLPDRQYEVLFSHIVERDAGGADIGEWFEPIHWEVE